jgi:glycerol-3-phosphate cytidylyltransferase
MMPDVDRDTGTRIADAFARPQRFLMAKSEGIRDHMAGRVSLRYSDNLIVRVSGNPGLLRTLRRAASLLNDPLNFGRAGIPPWWIGVGTALGYAREQRIIASDTDVDIRIGVAYRSNAEAFAFGLATVKLFYANRFVLMREVYFDGRPMQHAFVDLDNEGAILDIYYFYSGISEGRYLNINSETLRRKPAHLIENRRKVFWPGYANLTVNIPSPIEDYLAWRFGPEWRIPKKNSELGPVDTACFEPIPRVTVLAYGTWDLFHHGHLRLLERAAKLGDHLVVGVVSDAVAAQRGKQPMQSEDERAARVRDLPFVREVFMQRQLDQKEFDIERFGAAHLVIGDDWKDHPRYEQVRNYRGVQIHYLPRTPGISSTELREKLRSPASET